MSEYQYDLFIIGAGSGGLRTARIAASMGAKIAIAEERYLGGTCVNVGCVPKKLFVYASQFSEEYKNAKSFGWAIHRLCFDWKTLIRNKDKEIKRLNDVYKKQLDNAGIKIIYNRAKIIDPHTVEVDGQRITAEKILIATGAWPNIPNVPGKEYIISSNEAFHLESLPKKIVIVGGGYIAVEFTGIFHNLGVDTTLVYRDALFLRGFDHEVRGILADEMKKKKIKLKFDSRISQIKRTENQLIAILENGEQIITEQIMYATGRNPMTDNLGLEHVGIKLDKNKGIKINEQYQTSIPSIYAIGDVTNRVNLTPVALTEGTILAKHLFGNENSKIDYSNIPSCVFGQPNLGTVGLTEEQAHRKYNDIEIYHSKFTQMKYSLSDINEKTFIKLIVDKKSDRVVGAHMVGANAGEIIQGISIAMKAGATKKTFDSTVGIHPTIAEEFVNMKQATR